MELEEFRRHGHALIDWLADYHAGLASRPVQAPTRPGEVRAMLPAEPPENPEKFEACIADLDTIVAPNLSHWQHPRFFGYFPANAMMAGILGDLVSTGLGTVGLSWQSSPALSEVEEVVTDWVRRMVDLSSEWVGVISDTASTSTLVAMISARERTTDYGLAKGGLQAAAEPLVVYASAGSHSCVEKGALLAGFGRENVRMVPLDEAQGMRPDGAERADRARSRGGPATLRHRRRRRRYGDRVDRPAPRDRRHRASATACGCMSMPQWQGRR